MLCFNKVLDKLYILQQWYNDVKEETVECEITDITIPDYTMSIDDVDLKFVFELPEIAKELALLKYIISTYKDEMKSVDALFYFIFRFIQSINIDDDTLNVEDIETAEVLYKHLSMNKITNKIISRQPIKPKPTRFPSTDMNKEVKGQVEDEPMVAFF